VATCFADTIASLSPISRIEIRVYSWKLQDDQSEELMYLRRHVRQPILLRLFAGRSRDRARASSVATAVAVTWFILGNAK
jgi:hypothetical protein